MVSYFFLAGRPLSRQPPASRRAGSGVRSPVVECVTTPTAAATAYRLRAVDDDKKRGSDQEESGADHHHRRDNPIRQQRRVVPAEESFGCDCDPGFDCKTAT